MAVSVDDIYKRVNYLINKEQTGNILNKDEYNNCLKWANLELFKRLYGLPESYRPGQPLPPMAYEETQYIIDSMSRFKVNKGGRDYPVLLIDKNGQASLPADYVHYSSITYGKRPVEMLRDSQYQDRLDDSIVYPSKQDPICTLYGNYIQFQPIDLGSVNFVYLRLPDTPFWGATIVDDEYVYSPALSTQFEYGDVQLTDIASMIVGYASTNLREGFTKQVADSRTINGM